MNLPQANKELGQHFLRDQQIINKITEDYAAEAQAIIEVGPGPAILTKALAAHQLPFSVIEMDKRFNDYLSPILPAARITFQDALTIDWPTFLKEQGLENKKIWMVSNLPYNVSVPLTVSFLQVPQIQWMTLMYQKEVAEKIILIDQNKKNSMGSLMALCQNYFDCRLLCKVPPGAFSPPPKVDSAVVSFTRKSKPTVELSHFLGFEKFLRLVFANRRKQLGSVLKSSFSADVLSIALSHCQIDRTIRAEAFTQEQVINLYRALMNK